jgi:hypothetical protein
MKVGSAVTANSAATLLAPSASVLTLTNVMTFGFDIDSDSCS